MTGFVNVFAVLFLSTCIMVLSQFIFCKFFYYIFMLWFLSSSIYLLFFPAWSQRPHIGCLPYFVTWCGPSANLECRSETCCAWLGETAGPKKSPKIGHLGTIGQLCKATSSQLRHISTIEKNLLSSNISSTCPHNMVNFGPLAAEIGLVVWGTSANFNGFRVLAGLLHGTVVVGISQTLQRWTEGTTYIRQGGHYVGHWPTFLVVDF